MGNRFDGKRILITGGTNGIGLATAKRIVAEGGEVAVTGMSQEHLDQAGRELPDASLILRNDASDPEAAKELAEKVDRMGGLDGLFLNAGFGAQTPIDGTDKEMFENMVHVNNLGPVLQMTQLSGKLNDGAGVLLTSSVAPYTGMPGGAVYAATKAAMNAFSKSWARELGGRGIRVNSIAPGPIDTGFLDVYSSKSGGMSDEEKQEMAERIKKSTILGRFGNPDEVAAVAAFLLSDDAAYVTASEYFVDGGMTTH
ncbi:SDR family oxidoreductase [Sphingomicrobium aestuariivivum]|uniref:SDR family oxidoreductase n=1 Tax=Sphingomicrobium aestuariivivum TaxID=1582356 RepID=UPI001FD67572|nr:SDR family oxidoreductase [Sphingomicrobium aestuariivivum]MCJ8190336.1 SDR family oxidoreductase [Sphingomicrobium aestuariivivum]